MKKPKQIQVATLKGQHIVARANDSSEYPSINLYLDNGSELLLIGSVEDSLDNGLRIVTYSDLSNDEFTTAEKIK